MAPGPAVIGEIGDVGAVRADQRRVGGEAAAGEQHRPHQRLRHPPTAVRGHADHGALLVAQQLLDDDAGAQRDATHVSRHARQGRHQSGSAAVGRVEPRRAVPVGGLAGEHEAHAPAIGEPFDDGRALRGEGMDGLGVEWTARGGEEVGGEPLRVVLDPGDALETGTGGGDVLRFPAGPSPGLAFALEHHDPESTIGGKDRRGESADTRADDDEAGALPCAAA